MVETLSACLFREIMIVRVCGGHNNGEVHSHDGVEGSETESLTSVLLCVMFSLFILRNGFSSFTVLYLKFFFIVKSFRFLLNL